ncbi:MAG: hypothetical protein HZA19_06645 [Nitrospirae bacterium]|nr:hypothetical protein [Nitrospirota bacterium]
MRHRAEPMKPILHIVKDPQDTQALNVISRQARDNAYGVGVIFIQKAVTLPAIPNARTCALQDDAQGMTLAIGVEPIPYREMLNLIFSSEAITVW